MKDYDEWLLEGAPPVRVYMTVEVNDMVVFESDWDGVNALTYMEEDLRKPEAAIDEALRQEYELEVENNF